MTTPPYYLSRTGAHDLTPLVAPLPTFVGSAIKYLVRAGRKPGTPAVDDLRKAADCALKAVKYDTSGDIGAGFGRPLRAAANWCHPHPLALSLWAWLRDGYAAGVTRTAHDLLRALDAGEVVP